MVYPTTSLLGTSSIHTTFTRYAHCNTYAM